MTVNNTNLNYNSNWDIDQLTQSGTTTITAATGVNSYSIANVSFTNPPVVEVYYQPAGTNYWFQAASPIGGFGGTIGLNAMNKITVAWISSSTNLSVQVNNGSSGTINLKIRYYIWSDKINY